jgi:hypothetical protein
LVESPARSLDLAGFVSELSPAQAKQISANFLAAVSFKPTEGLTEPLKLT